MPLPFGSMPVRSQSAVRCRRVSRSAWSMPSSALAQLVGRRALARVELARGVAHVLLELRQVVGHALAIVGQLLDVRAPVARVGRHLSSACLTRSAWLFSSAVRRSASRAIEPRRPVASCDCTPPSRLLASRSRSAARRASAAALRIRRRPPHVVLRLPQTIERLLRRLLAARARASC